MSLPRINPNATLISRNPNLARLQAERDTAELARQDRVQAIRRANHLGSVDAAAFCIALLLCSVLACVLLMLIS